MKEVTSKNYYEPDEYLSASAMKLYLKCELQGLTGYRGEPSTAMLVGSYVDSYIEGTLKEFKTEHPEIISSKGATKGELKSDFKKAIEICEYIDNNRVFTQFMSGQKQVIMTGAIEGIPFKIKMDSYSPHIAINDLKVMRSVTDRNGNFYDFITPWGYDIQLACYQEIVFQNTGERLPVYICAVTKEDPINSVIINIPQGVLDVALFKVKEIIERVYAIKMGNEVPTGCGICKSCISNRKNETPIISLYDITGGGYNDDSETEV